MHKSFEVPLEKLRYRCDLEEFGFQTTEEITALKGTIGQERAMDAIGFGLGIKTHGFNMFIAGPPGTGKSSTIKSSVEEIARKESTPPDWCYAYNFADPDRPLAISLPAGKGNALSKDMDNLVSTCKLEIPKAFESEQYGKRKTQISDKFKQRRDELLNKLEAHAKEKGFTIQLSPTGMSSVPVVNGKPIKQEQYTKLSETQKKGIEEKGKVMELEMNEALVKVRKLEKEFKEEMESLDKETTLFVLGHLIDELKEKYKEHPRVKEYLEAVKEDITNNSRDFLSTEEKAPVIMGIKIPLPEPTFSHYQVNVLVNNAQTKGAPVIIENNPTYYNLFGGTEYHVQLGMMLTDFHHIRPGAIHRANGGYLILQALDVLKNYFSWDALKRAIRSKEGKIENIGEQFRIYPTTGIKPESIPLNVKVILVGSRFIYYLLYLLDEDFQKLFKVKADFDVQMKRTKEHIEKYASFIAARCKESGLKHFDKTGAASIVEYGCLLSEDQTRISTHFMEIADLISESSFWANKENSKYVQNKHVERAIEEKTRRSNLPEEKIQELIEEGTILIDTEGEKIGQINGLSVYYLGDYLFGKPSRITASTYVGKAGVINIERETKLSGRIHDKGVMILHGYIGGKYGQDKPLSLSVSLCFEQSYQQIEGDSASCAELYAILSSLAEVPLNQGIAITGSVNQRGEVQPIGGVNRKIEGFFDVCKAKGLNGKQGVIIPQTNIRHLMLKDEVLKAVQQRKFHIYAINNVDEGIEILTGLKPGKRLASGKFEKGSFNEKVDTRLRYLAQRLQKFTPKAK